MNTLEQKLDYFGYSCTDRNNDFVVDWRDWLYEIEEFNIGHFIISESIFDGFKHTIKKFKRIIKS